MLPFLLLAPTDLISNLNLQAKSIRQDLLDLGLPSDCLWLTSPLSRAIETFMLACPYSDLLPNQEGAPNVVVRSDISEGLFTSGDVGLPPSILCQRFPELREQLQELDDVWWYSAAENPNCPIRGTFGNTEPKDIVQRRIKSFKEWLLDRPEKVIVAFGHSCFWKRFWQSCQGEGARREHMYNCEIYKMVL